MILSGLEMVYLKAAKEITINFDFIMRSGLSELMSGLEKAIQFDPP